VWYFFRERTYPDIIRLFEKGKQTAEGAALMTDTKFTYEILGSAWPGHFNKPMAVAMYDNIRTVSLPKWTDDDQLLAKATQIEMKSARTDGLAVKLDTIGIPDDTKPAIMGGSQLVSLRGGSDDISDISWSLPTIVLTYPSNIPGLPGHHWSNAISMATPIAHKGIIAGAKAEALTLMDLFLKPELLKASWDYYKNEQTKDIQYTPLIGPKDNPAIQLNKEIMSKFKPELTKYYYNPAKYKTYLEQLGIKYPTVRPDQKEAVLKEVTK
jgi:aminobenzoyl-glutamate utilization protein B